VVTERPPLPAPLAPIVIKLGGRALERPGSEAELAASLLALDRPAVLVHGGGREVSDWSRRLGLEPRFEGGLRVTDAPSLEIAAAVLGGLANARLVARLRSAGVDAAGLGAGDGGLIEAAPHPDAARLGHVGVATGVRPRALAALLAAGLTPVVSSIGALDRTLGAAGALDGTRGAAGTLGAAGALVNLNADEVAGALAAALAAEALVLLTDVPGVLLGGTLVPAIGPGELAAVLASDDVKDGMRPKLEAARRALAGGARRVLITTWQGPGTLAGLLDGRLPATRITPSIEESAHA